MGAFPVSGRQRLTYGFALGAATKWAMTTVAAPAPLTAMERRATGLSSSLVAVAVLVALVTGLTHADAIAVVPASVAPGDPVPVVFPRDENRVGRGELRGVAYDLLRWDGEAWARDYVLLFDKDPHGARAVSTRGGGAVAIVALGVGGAGPDFLRTPYDAPPGTYRVCVHGDADRCTILRIVERDG